jgi:hypothetical protein
MHIDEWPILDTETTGFAPPIFVVDLRLNGCEDGNHTHYPTVEHRSFNMLYVRRPPKNQ